MYHEDFPPPSGSRQQNSEMRPASLCDQHGRPIRYLRLAITDRCNLRCRYCMPEEGVVPVGHTELLSYEEMARLVGLLLPLGIDKVRITGGEPFARRDCLGFLRSLKDLGVPGLHLTTNGVATWRYLDGLRALGLSGLNLSIDSLDRQHFAAITRRDQLGEVLKTLHGALALGIPVKINTVALPDISDAEIRQLAALAREYPLTLRFIEPMAFSGNNGWLAPVAESLAARLARLFPEAAAPWLNGVPNSIPDGVAQVFSLPGFRGKIGFIAGHSRSFCQRCDKIRVTAVGMLKNCLYDNGVCDLRRLLRSGAGDAEIAGAIRAAVGQRHPDGHLTEKHCARSQQPSMATIGG
jgi:cyclic pyranopterin phosphate synthase